MIVVSSAGCYTLEPAGGVTPEVGTGAAFDINDAGRVALGGAMGPEIDQIEGKVLSKDGPDYTVGVTAVHLLRGGTQIWHGESVRINSSYVNTMYLRRFSAGKTIAISAIGVVAVAALTRVALVTTGGADPTEHVDSLHTARRIPVPRKIPLQLKLQLSFPPTTP